MFLMLICLFLLANFCLAYLWYSFKTILVMFEYRVAWGILGILSVFLGIHGILSVFFVINQPLEYEEEMTLFKRLWISFAGIVLFLALSLVGVLNYNKDQKDDTPQDKTPTTQVAQTAQPPSTQDTATPKPSSNDTPAPQNRPDNAQSDVEKQIRHYQAVGAKNLNSDPSWQQAKQEIRQLFKDPNAINPTLQEVARIYNQQLPIKLDDEFTILRMSASNQSLQLHIQLNKNLRLTTTDEQQRLALIKDNNICQSFDVFLEHGISIHYHYYNKNNAHIRTISINPKDCR